MAIERYLLENRHLEPLGFGVVGLEIIAVEAYIYLTDGLSQAGSVMLGLGLLCLLMSGYRWRTRDEMENPGNVSLFKHVFLVVLIAVVGAQATGVL